MINFLKKSFNYKIVGAPLIFFIGFGLFVWCTFFPFGEISPKWFAFASKSGEILLISSFISFLTSAADFMGVFKNALEDIVYDSRFLKNRKDIEKVWIKVSEVLFDSKFPKIRKKLMETIKANYLSVNGVVSYSSYRNTYEVDFCTESDEYILTRNDISFILHAADRKEFVFPLRFWVNCEDCNRDKTFLKIESLKVNGDIVIPDLKEVEKLDGGLCYIYEIKLKGHTEYNIEQVIYKRNLFVDDNYLGFQAKWLVDGMTIQLFYPQDKMKATFIHRGTSDNFFVKKRKGFLESNYKGLILRRQGFIIILNRK